MSDLGVQALWAIPSNPGTPAYINNAMPAPVVNTSALTFAMWYYSVRLYPRRP